MNRCLLCILVLLCSTESAAICCAAHNPASETPGAVSAAFDPASFAAELHRLSEILHKKPSRGEMAALRDSLPKAWNVSTPERTYSISSEPLRNQLTSLSSEKARVWVDRLASEIDEYSAAREEVGTSARTELQKILAKPEFAAVRGPSAWELLRQRIIAWTDRLLLRLFGGILRHPIGGRILFWVLLIAGILFTALWVFRFLSSRDRMDALPQSEFVVASRTWQEWIRLAREAANRGDFREAVHSAYWTGIVRLEDAGVVPKERTRTPREYLRLVAEPAPGEMASPLALREPLSALTSRLERAWYANRGAGPEDFRESLRHLEALGCRLD